MFCPRCGMRGGGQGQSRQQNTRYEEDGRENNGILYVMIGVMIVLMLFVVGFGGYHLIKSRNNAKDTQTTAKADTKSADSEKEAVEVVPATATPTPVVTVTVTPVPTATAVPVPTVIATPIPTAVPTVMPAEPVYTGGYYIFPDSSNSYLSRAQVESLDVYTLYLARNEIYARHGRMFKNSDLQQYFGSQSWYMPLYSPENFDEGVFNAYEKENINLIKSVEQAYGSPYL